MVQYRRNEPNKAIIIETTFNVKLQYKTKESGDIYISAIYLFTIGHFHTQKVCKTIKQIKTAGRAGFLHFSFLRPNSTTW
jgi:hypothetical protein